MRKTGTAARRCTGTSVSKESEAVAEPRLKGWPRFCRRSQNHPKRQQRVERPVDDLPKLRPESEITSSGLLSLSRKPSPPREVQKPKLPPTRSVRAGKNWFEGGARARGPPAGARSRPGRTRRPPPPGRPAARLCKSRAAAAGRGRGGAQGAAPMNSGEPAFPGGYLRGGVCGVPARRAAHRSPEARAPSLTSLTASSSHPQPPRPGPRAAPGQASRNPVRPTERAHWPPGAAGLHKYMVPGHGAGQGESAAPAASLLPSWTPPLRLHSWK